MWPVEFSLAHWASRGLFAMSKDQIFLWEVKYIIPTLVKFDLTNV